MVYLLHDMKTSQPLVGSFMRKIPLLHRDLGREIEFVGLWGGTSTIEKTCFQDDLEKFLFECAYSRLLSVSQ
jgi:hypothetical protein